MLPRKTCNYQLKCTVQWFKQKKQNLDKIYIHTVKALLVEPMPPFPRFIFYFLQRRLEIVPVKSLVQNLFVLLLCLRCPAVLLLFKFRR